MKRIMIFILIGFFSAMTLSAATTKINTLGQSPFYGWVEDAETARMVVKGNLGAIKYALNMTYGLEKGNKIFFALCEEINRVEIGEVYIKPGHEMEFMLFKSRGFQRVSQNVKWVGKESFKAFLFFVDYNAVEYEDKTEFSVVLFIVPQECGNISLMCDSKATIISEKIIKEEFTKLEEPRIIETEVKSEELISTEIAATKRLNEISDITALLARSCYGKYILARLGLEYSLSKEFSIVGTVGLAAPLSIKQTWGWKPFFICDLSLRYKIHRFSFGAGAGFSSLARKGRVDAYSEALANVGVNLSKSTMLFFETRIPLTQLKKINYFPHIAHKFILGIRYSHK